MRRFALLALALGLVAFTAKAQTNEPPPPPQPKTYSILITSLNAGGTYTSPLTITGVYSPDPLPVGYVRIEIEDSKGALVYDELADIENKGVFSSTVKIAPAGTYSVRAYIVYTSASDAQTINVK